MIIKKYNKYKNNNDDFFILNKGGFSYFYHLTILLSFYFGYVKREGILNFIKKCSLGVRFDIVNVDIDNQSNLVYINESYDPHDPKFDTPEINKLLEEENFIAVCKMGLLAYNVMTKDNFIHLLFAWDEILVTLPPFALLYQDDQGWYDVMPFESQKAMDGFIAQHTPVENLHE